MNNPVTVMAAGLFFRSGRGFVNGNKEDAR